MALVFPSSPTTGQIFAPGAGLPTWMWDGSKWTNATTPPLHLASLSDVNASGAVNGQALTFNGTNWANSNALSATDQLQWNSAGNFALGVAPSDVAALDIQPTVPIPAGGMFATRIVCPDNNSGGSALFVDGPATGAGNTLSIRAGVDTTGSTALRVSSRAGVTVFQIGNANQIQFPTLGTTNATATAFLQQTQQNQLYYTTSARRWKANIRDVTREQARAIVRKLRIVTFKSLCEADDPQQNFYGLIAEDVAAIEPALAHYDKDGQPSGVQYDRVLLMLLPLVQELLGMDEPEGEVYG